MSAIDFFDRQFRRQVEAAEYELNPFERAVLPYLHGRVLDLGCGLGNLSLAAAALGGNVTAIDACARAVEDLRRRAAAQGLAVAAHAADLRDWRPPRMWDSVACIGLLMFLSPRQAHRGLEAVRDAVAPGGVAAVNVLIEGTTYLEMFGGDPYCLFAPGELAAAFEGWDVRLAQRDDYPAAGGTIKRFETLVAVRPRAA